jgi:DNA-binding response OmpR family regulator
MSKTIDHRKKILIVEDEVTLLELIADKFASEGFDVLRATSAEKGIKLALKNKPDLILLDIILLKMDGISMLRQLRKDS